MDNAVNVIAAKAATTDWTHFNCDCDSKKREKNKKDLTYDF